MNIDELTGRALDALVAERVFRLEVEVLPNPQTGEIDAFCRAASGQSVRVAFYSRSLSASLTVEAELLRVGWARVDHQAGARSITAPVRVLLKHRGGRTVEASGPFETALCRAALKAVACELVAPQL